MCTNPDCLILSIIHGDIIFRNSGIVYYILYSCLGGLKKATGNIRISSLWSEIQSQALLDMNLEWKIALSLVNIMSFFIIHRLFCCLIRVHVVSCVACLASWNVIKVVWEVWHSSMFGSDYVARLSKRLHTS